MTTSAALSDNAAALHAALDANSTKATVQRDQLIETMGQIFPAVVAAGATRTALAALLDELIESGDLTAPRDRRRWDGGRPALPDHIRLRRTAPERTSAPGVVWRPELAWAASTALTASQTDHLRAVNRWLRDASASVELREPIPMRERSVEIFGDEKRLEALLPTSLFAPGRLTLTTLCTFRLPVPLAIRRIGGTPTVLVAENSDTFHSLHDVLRPDPGLFGYLAYGGGSAFESAVADLRHLGQIGRIFYFGDLDANGLAIPARASVTAQDIGLPPVEPASFLYRNLLTRTPTAGARVERGRAADLASWLETDQQSAVQDLLEQGRRLAQEALGRSHLRRLRSGQAWTPAE
ncbi:Wadjet anti-phage system protein JetD domain-containing protein [Glycomyces sp. MUSA5-2]|uniref:Wadjet anti-phage system protein JetD domain-containing protein n=1 Tax=Glycomyces sp. MUSA5-2 TaxID=2053002 RepID=UPI0030088ABD